MEIALCFCKVEECEGRWRGLKGGKSQSEATFQQGGVDFHTLPDNLRGGEMEFC